ncbi:hypothetical protein BGX27_000658, partial [Mortierella sp. AM989]
MTRPQQDPIQNASLNDIKYHSPQLPVDIVQPPQYIFQDVAPPVARYALPKINERIASTSQLVYCLSLLCLSFVSKEQFGDLQFSWSQARANDLDELDRLQTLAIDLIRAFARDALKKPDVVSEIRGKIRLQEMELGSRDVEAFKELLRYGFKQQGIKYLKDSATAVYDKRGVLEFKDQLLAVIERSRISLICSLVYPRSIVDEPLPQEHKLHQRSICSMSFSVWFFIEPGLHNSLK